MLIYKSYRGMTYTIEFFTDIGLYPGRFYAHVQWTIFNASDHKIHIGQANDLTAAEKAAHEQIEWRVPQWKEP